MVRDGAIPDDEDMNTTDDPTTDEPTGSGSTTGTDHDAPPPPPPPPPAGARRQLRRSHDQRIGGVIGGIADYAGLDPSLTRLLAVVLLFASFGFVFVAYLVLWAVLPRHDGVATTLDEVRGRVSGSSRGRILGLLLALAVAAIVFGGVFDGQTGAWLVPLALIVGGAALLSRRGDDAPVAVAPTPPAPPSPPTADVDGPAPVEVDGRPGSALAVPSNPYPSPPPPPPAVAPPKEPNLITPVVLSLMIFAAGIVVLLDRVDVIDATLTLVGGIWLLLVAAGLGVSAFRGRSTGLIVVGVLVAMFTVTARYVDPVLTDGTGDVVHSVTSPAQLPDEYRLGAGELTVDLSDLVLDGETVELDVVLGVGELRVLVSDDIELDLKIDNAIGVARYVSNSADVIDGRELLDEGIDNDIAVRALVEEPTGTLVLDVELGIGDVEVTHVP